MRADATHGARKLRSSGCADDDPWLAKAMPDMLNSKILHPSWQKMLPIYCCLKRHKMALWLDSDIYITDPHQPLELLLHASGFLESASPCPAPRGRSVVNN